ncbi:10610_t:CDS:2, partial [Dentiscutata heterogama]
LTIDNNKRKQPIYESEIYNKHSSDKNLENTNATTKTNRPFNDNKKIKRNEDRQKKNSKTDIQRNKKPLDKDTRTRFYNINRIKNNISKLQELIDTGLRKNLDII